MAITASALPNILSEIERQWRDGINKSDYIADVDTIRALREQQTATVTLAVGSKEVKAKTVWIESCTTGLADCTDDCEFDGPESNTNGVEYSLDLCKEATFKVETEVNLRGNHFTPEQFIANELLMKMKELDEWYNQQALAVLEAEAGIPDLNRLPAGWTWDSVAGNIVVPSAHIESIAGFNHLAYIGKVNKFPNPFVISGYAWYNAYLTAMQNAGNGEGSGDEQRRRMMKAYFDLLTVDNETAPDLRTFIVNKGSVAFAEHAWNANAGVNDYIRIGQYRFTMASKNIPGLVYDVFSEQKCTSTSKVYEVYKLKLNGAIMVNPTVCNADRTGIIKLRSTLAV